MNEYACTPGAEPGTFIISIEFPRALTVNDGVRTYPAKGLRGFYRARMRGFAADDVQRYLSLAALSTHPMPWPYPWPGVVIDDAQHMLAAIADLESMIVK